MSDRYDAAREGFDQLAGQYDADMQRQADVLERYRRVQRAAMSRHFPAGGTVLELGCGTGEETRFLVEQGWRVIATDVSPEMARRTTAKLEQAGLAGRCETRTGSSVEVTNGLLRDGVRVDAVLSSLGPLNCEPDLEGLGEALSRLLPPGAPLVLTPMARWCPWEIAAYGMRGKLRQAVRRLGPGPLPVPVGDTTVPVWYYSPRELIDRLGPAFRTVALRGLGVFLPPPYLHRVGRVPGLLDALDRLDTHLASRFPFRRLGDHSLIVLARR